MNFFAVALCYVDGIWPMWACVEVCVRVSTMEQQLYHARPYAPKRCSNPLYFVLWWWCVCLCATISRRPSTSLNFYLALSSCLLPANHATHWAEAADALSSQFYQCLVMMIMMPLHTEQIYYYFLATKDVGCWLMITRLSWHKGNSSHSLYHNGDLFLFLFIFFFFIHIFFFLIS